MQIFGTYNKTIYRNRRTGFTSFLIDLYKYDSNGRKMYHCKGVIPAYASEVPLKLTGSIKNDSNGESVFLVESSEYDVNESRLETFFIKAHLPVGLGQKAAESIEKIIVDRGQRLDDFIKDEDAVDEISKVRGITATKAITFINKVNASLLEKDLFYELSKFGMTYHHVEMLIERYGNKAKEMLTNDTYSSLHLIGIPFTKIDAYAKEIGYQYHDERRIKALCVLTSEMILAYGHSYVNQEEYLRLFRMTENMYSSFDEEIPDALVYLNSLYTPSLVYEKERFYNHDAVKAESIIANKLKQMVLNKKNLLDEDTIKKYKEKSHLDDTQKQIFDFLSSTDACILIGGPGTGKTSSIKDFLNAYKREYPDKSYALCAPTGRAAQRLKESTNEVAVTINRLLEFKFQDDIATPTRNSKNLLEQDLIIIDEFSMVGIFLFSQLLQAMKPECKLVIVGDWNQLQSVEPGDLLHDLVLSEQFRTVRLETSHRQDKDSSIYINSKKLLKGEEGIIEDGSFELIRCNHNEEAFEVASKLFLKEYSSDDISDCLAMIPTRKGDYGTSSFNRFVQSELHDTSEPYIAFGNKLFFMDERIMSNKNTYSEHEFYNGDLWKISNITSDTEMELKGLEEQVEQIDEEYFDILELAYSMTIHKCQGTEADRCIILLPDAISKRLIIKSLLYTAITRAKKKITIISVNGAFEKYLHAPMNLARNSNIRELLAA